MGHKKICLDCKKAFSQGTNSVDSVETNCPDCGQPMTLVNQKFRPPKITDNKKWDVVKYLVQNGFTYDHINNSSGTDYVDYPDNLRDAKEFVVKYKSQVQRTNT